MTQLYLPGVEANLRPGPYRTLIEAATRRGEEYSKIWDLLAFQDFTIHLVQFTQAVLRAPTSISPGLRELIAAFTSFQNECGFCAKAHAATAGELLGDHDLVWQALRDLEQSPLTEKEKALLRFVGKLTNDPTAIHAADVQAVQAVGWDDEAIYYAITACALFNFYNRWITATGVQEMSDDAHRQQGRRLAGHGYIRD